jgi:Flp pilus assembly pilin Flp
MHCHPVTMKLRTFRDDPSGAVTVDWVVLTAALIGLAIIAAVSLQVSVVDLANLIERSMTAARVIAFRLVS